MCFDSYFIKIFLKHHKIVWVFLFSHTAHQLFNLISKLIIMVVTPLKYYIDFTTAIIICQIFFIIATTFYHLTAYVIFLVEIVNVTSTSSILQIKLLPSSVISSISYSFFKYVLNLSFITLTFAFSPNKAG